jgi:7,8-dihydropterin-6-yl-methyl-4-(beta-D-ribofuranosyl)aminobenzene 5'-phosphate synthase
MTTKITIVCENAVSFQAPILGEHGFACHIEHEGKNYLYDTGRGFSIIQNALSLETDLNKLDSIILSHGHFDHTGGLKDVLEFRHRKPIKVYTHENIFDKKYYAREDGYLKYAGIPFVPTLLKNVGAEFVYNKEFLKIGKGIYVTGEVPKLNDYEYEPRLLIVDNEGNRTHDEMLDDNSVILETKKGIVILLGCAHSGVVNICNYVHSKLQKNIHAVIGGTHLYTADENRFIKTVEMLKKYNVKKIGTSHCTGIEKAARLKEIFKDRFFFANAGVKITF